MMGGSNWGHDMMGGYGLIGVVLWLIVLIDLVLLGVWLWKQIVKK